MTALRIVGVAVSALAIVLAAGPSPTGAQVGPQLLITMNLAGPVKEEGGEYFIAFNADNTILLGPRSDSSYWTHYVLYRDRRFYFGEVPTTPSRPFDFLTIRPPQPYLFGQVLPDRRSLRVSVGLADLGVRVGTPARVKVNFLTVDESLKPLDALGRGPGDPFGFVTVDLRKDTFVIVTHAPQNCPDPALCIAGGDIRIASP